MNMVCLISLFNSQVLFQVGLAVLALAGPELQQAGDDCAAMSILTSFLSGVSNTDTTSTSKAIKVRNCTYVCCTKGKRNGVSSIPLRPRSHFIVAYNNIALQ